MSEPRHLAAIPFPGRGHINSILNLSRNLVSSPSSSNLLLSVILTEEWFKILTSDDLPPSPANLRFVTIPNVIPSEFGRANNYDAFIYAVMTKMEDPLEQLLDQLAVEGIIADSILPWVMPVGIRRNIPVYSYFPMSASYFSVYCHILRVQGFALRAGHVTDSFEGEADEPLGKYIPSHESTKLSDVHAIVNSSGPRKKLTESFTLIKKAQCVLLASIYEIEAPLLDALREHLHCPIFSIGPSIPYMIPMSTTTLAYIEWLNSQSKESVLYISLGSFLSVSAAQLDEIAMGIRLSGTRFLWVARQDSHLRLQEMAGDMGIFVQWCDQLRVLSHPSIGGFLTHCGWNSTMEAVFCGVPMLTFPILVDQPVNSRLIVDEWKIGLSLKGKIGGNSFVAGDDIGLNVKKLMDLEGAESKEMRRRARELQDSAHRVTEVGGSSIQNLETFLKGFMQGDCYFSGH